VETRKAVELFGYWTESRAGPDHREMACALPVLQYWAIALLLAGVVEGSGHSRPMLVESNQIAHGSRPGKAGCVRCSQWETEPMKDSASLLLLRLERVATACVSRIVFCVACKCLLRIRLHEGISRGQQMIQGLYRDLTLGFAIRTTLSVCGKADPGRLSRTTWMVSSRPWKFMKLSRPSTAIHHQPSRRN
jgi:hypothetical protein